MCFKKNMCSYCFKKNYAFKMLKSLSFQQIYGITHRHYYGNYRRTDFYFYFDKTSKPCLN